MGETGLLDSSVIRGGGTAAADAGGGMNYSLIRISIVEGVLESLD
jgi:hypothetical protein